MLGRYWRNADFLLDASKGSHLNKVHIMFLFAAVE
jgi:hypothetical protein